ncbi:MAG: PEP-CTERM sorting domain-containing protein [Phycisphaerae bacterium]|nr:PEP-CTERM sorting domain-containing protein [Phycisphaerae bacterium]
MRRLAGILMVLALVGLVAVPASADYWIGGSTMGTISDWTTAASWTGSSDTMYFGATGTGPFGQDDAYAYLDSSFTDIHDVRMAGASINASPTTTGYLEIRNGGTMNIARMYVGRATYGTGTLIVQNGGTLNATNVSAGFDGNGTLTVDSGGTVAASAYFYAGFGSAHTGTVTVNGTVTAGDASTDYTHIGYDGTGTVTINTGGSFTASGNMRFGSSGGNGLVTQNGGTVDVAGQMYLGYGGGGTGKYELKGGTLHLRSADGVVVGYSATSTNCSLEVSGGTISTTNQNADTGLAVSNGSKYKVIGDDATIAFKGNYSLAGTSTMSFDVDSGGVSRTQIGTDGTGTVALGSGTLELSVSEALGSLTFITLIDKQSSGAVSGTFNGLAEGDGVTLGTFGSVTYTGKIGYAGDYATSASSGGNDVVIYDIVPEPATMSLLLLGLPLALRRRKRA